MNPASQLQTGLQSSKDTAQVPAKRASPALNMVHTFLVMQWSRAFFQYQPNNVILVQCLLLARSPSQQQVIHDPCLQAGERSKDTDQVPAKAPLQKALQLATVPLSEATALLRSHQADDAPDAHAAYESGV